MRATWPAWHDRGVMWFFALVIVLLIGAVAVVASGRWGSMSEVYDDRPDMVVPARQPLTSDDIQASRFAIGLRGYRMDEVDTLLERVAHEVAERDRRIAELERAARPTAQGPGGTDLAPEPEPDPDEARGSHRAATSPDRDGHPVPDPVEPEGDDAAAGERGVLGHEWFSDDDENAERPA